MIQEDKSANIILMRVSESACPLSERAGLLCERAEEPKHCWYMVGCSFGRNLDLKVCTTCRSSSNTNILKKRMISVVAEVNRGYGTQKCAAAVNPLFRRGHGPSFKSLPTRPWHQNQELHSGASSLPIRRVRPNICFALIDIERAYTNRTLENDMESIIDIFVWRSNRDSYFF